MVRGGRCSAVSALGANLLQLHPGIEVANGKMRVAKKYRGSWERCLKNYIKERLEGRNDIRSHRIFITYTETPFHSSKEEAEDGTLRKLSSLKGQKVTKARLNFGGNANELWCEGGELRFLLTMIEESRNYRKNCGWFTSLVSKEKNLGKLTAKLKSTDIAEHRIIEMHQGTKTSRILAWRF